jgi:siroheme decarboxylase
MQLLSIVQDRFPLVPDPWESIAVELGIPHEEVLERLRNLSSQEILFSIGPVIEINRAGPGSSTLIAMKVHEKRVGEVAGIINEYPEVSHNYLRNHEYNLWFTLSCDNREKLLRTKQEILARCGVPEDEVLDLPTQRRFKIHVRFRIPGIQGGDQVGPG